MKTAAEALAVAAVLVTVLFSKREHCRSLSVAITLVLVLMVHTEFDNTLSMVTSIAIFIINGWVMVLGEPLRFPPRWTLLFIVWAWGIDALHQTDLTAFAAEIIKGAGLILFAGNVWVLGRHAMKSMAWVTAIVLIGNALLTVRERLPGGTAPWPRRDGVTVRADGVNNLWDGAGGRALGTMGWSITLGEACALLVICAVWFAAVRRSRLWWAIALVGFLPIILSGTRTAVIMLAVSLAVVVLVTTRRLVFVLPAAVAAVALLLQSATSLPRLFGFDQGSELTRSVQHREAVWDSLPHVLDGRQLLDVVGGIGYNHASSLLTSGFIDAGSSAIFDNEIVRSLIGIGVVGMILLGLAALSAARRGGPLTLCALVAAGVGALSYDTFTWRSLTFLVVFFLAIDRTRRSDESEVEGSDVREGNFLVPKSRETSPSI